MKQYKVLYVTSSSYSGSTLLAFLLNTHPEIFTVSEMIGWNFDDHEDFRCSCGDALDHCVFFTQVARTFAANGLPFKTNRFGTAYQIVDNERFNRYLTENLPRCHHSTLEIWRDNLIRHLPLLSTRKRQIDIANEVFVETALKYSGARIFADVSKEPHRIRHLSKIPTLALSTLYLVRDIRGVVVSNMRERANDVRTAARIWLWDQHDILRIQSEFSEAHTLFYEDLCSDVDRELFAIHDWLGLPRTHYPGDFKGGEHHILGNSMRTREVSEIVLDQKWKSVLSQAELDAIHTEMNHFLVTHPDSPARLIIEHYMTSNDWHL